MLVHMGFIVESYLFRLMHQKGLIGDWDTPYEYIELAEVLRSKGYVYDSVDKFLEKKEIEVKVPGGTHDALFDAKAALEAFKLLS